MKKALFLLLLSIATWLPAGNWTLPEGAREQDGVISVAAASSSDLRLCNRSVPIQQFAGKKIRISAEIKANHVSRPEQEWNGIKFGISITAEKPVHYNAAGLWGTYDWEKTEVEVFVPREAKSAFLFVGLQGSSGSADFRNIEVEEIRTERNLENQEALKTDGTAISLSSGGWRFQPGAAPLNGGQNAVIEAIRPAGSERGTAYAERPLNLSPYAGKKVYIDYEISADDVSRPVEKWLGIKVMVTYDTGGVKKYIDCEPQGLAGTFDWTKQTHTFVVPQEIKNAKLHLGLQDVSGKVRFRNLRLRTIDLADLYPAPVAVPENFRCVYTDRILKEPALRGVMSPFEFRAEDFEELAKWNVNFIRWQLAGLSHADARDLTVYRKWLQGKLAEFDSVLEACEKYQIRVILDLHCVPGGRLENRDNLLFYEQKYRDEFLATWRLIAERYRGRKIYAYDLINEPQQTEKATTEDYLALQWNAANMIRAIDPGIPIVIEANMSSTPPSYQYLHPLPLKDIIYQVHSYYPGSFTHQGVYSKGKYGVIGYPTAEINMNALRQDLKYPLEFQSKYGARIYVGEFSAIRWAPGADRYIADCISLFEEFGWDWTFHAFREWSGWSVEHSDDRAVKTPVETTRRKEVLLEAFRKNRK